MADKNSKLDTALIRELAAILREGDLGEIELEHGDLRVRVSKSDGSPVHVTAQAPVATAPVPVAAAPAPTAPMAPTPAAQSAAPAADGPGVVKSPMVGTAYLSPDPDSPEFIKVGDTVAEGQTLLLVEAMKTYNPIPAPKAGKVKAIIVADAAPVEFGEPLVEIE